MALRVGDWAHVVVMSLARSSRHASLCSGKMASRAELCGTHTGSVTDPNAMRSFAQRAARRAAQRCGQRAPA
jgi:hypothetical protein